VNVSIPRPPRKRQREEADLEDNAEADTQVSTGPCGRYYELRLSGCAAEPCFRRRRRPARQLRVYEGAGGEASSHRRP
jgi:hypothetical protein